MSSNAVAGVVGVVRSCETGCIYQLLRYETPSAAKAAGLVGLGTRLESMPDVVVVPRGRQARFKANAERLSDRQE